MGISLASRQPLKMARTTAPRILCRKTASNLLSTLRLRRASPALVHQNDEAQQPGERQQEGQRAGPQGPSQLRHEKDRAAEQDKHEPLQDARYSVARHNLTSGLFKVLRLGGIMPSPDGYVKRYAIKKAGTKRYRLSLTIEALSLPIPTLTQSRVMGTVE